MKAEAPKRNQSNADDCDGCAEELHPEDGRVTYDDSHKHKGDWGRHRKEEQIEVYTKGKNGQGN